MSENGSRTCVVNQEGRTLIRVVLQGATNERGKLLGYEVIIRNFAAGQDFTVQFFTVAGSHSRLDVLRGAWSWSHKLAGVLECDHQEGHNIDWSQEA